MTGLKNVKLLLAMLVGVSIGTLGMIGCEVSSEDSVNDFEGDDPGECLDDADNDRDGLFDCADPDCSGSPDCTGDTGTGSGNVDDSASENGSGTGTGSTGSTDTGTGAGTSSDDTGTGAGNDTGTGNGGGSDTGNGSGEDDTGTGSGSDTGTGAGSDTGTGQGSDTGTGTVAGDGEIGPGSDGVLQIWTVGDSITLGTDNGYRNQLWEGLTSLGYSLDYVGSLQHPYPDTSRCTDVDHDGHSGYTISQITDEIDGWYSGITTPDLVLMMAGTNDLAWWVQNRDVPNGFAEQMVQLIDKVLAYNAGIKVVVSTIPPMESDVVKEANVDREILGSEYNAALKELVEAHAQYGERLWMADVHAALQVSDLYDGVHPTRDGYDKVGDVWLNAISPYLSDSGK